MHRVKSLERLDEVAPDAMILDIEMPDPFMTKITQIQENNLNKWRQAFSKNEKNRIGPITGQALIDWGYENDRNWYRSSGI